MQQPVIEAIVFHSKGGVLATVAHDWNRAWIAVRPAWCARRGLLWTPDLISTVDGQPWHGWTRKERGMQFWRAGICTESLCSSASNIEIYHAFGVETEHGRQADYKRIARGMVSYIHRSGQTIIWDQTAEGLIYPRSDFYFQFRRGWFAKRGNVIHRLPKGQEPHSCLRIDQSWPITDVEPPFEELPEWLIRAEPLQTFLEQVK